MLRSEERESVSGRDREVVEHDARAECIRVHEIRGRGAHRGCGGDEHEGRGALEDHGECLL